MTIQTDVIADDNTPPANDEAAVSALMDRWTPKADKAEDAAETQETDENAEDEGYEAGGEPEVEETEEDEEGQEGAEAAEAAKEPTEAEKAAAEGPKEIADDMVAKVTVDGAEVTLTGAQLKRLAGQEAALTQKSQKATEIGTRAQTVLVNALALAKEDLDEYEGVDWLVEQTRMDPEWFEFHRGRALQAEQRFGHLLQAAQAVRQDQETRQAEISEELKTQAAERLKALVPDWSDAHEASIQSYMISQGITEESAKALMDPVVKHLVNKARLYDEGKAKAADKIAKAPQKKTLAPAGATGAEVKTKAIQAAESRMKSGKANDDDAAAVLMARWTRTR